MKRSSTTWVGVVVLAAAVSLVSGLGAAPKSPAIEPAEPATRRAVSPDAAQANEAIAELRATGPAGLQALLREHDATLRRELALAPGERAAQPEWRRLCAALDGVGGQYDNWASRLYWYTDWEQARRASLDSGKPILSLRLLGNLQEELSCANSRFFRTALYPNAQIGDYLRDNYVLYWQSVRPAPKVTVDFGDGRKIQTTITGNSIHYVMTPEGEIIDALPGLYSPKAFLRWLQASDATAKACANMDEAQRTQYLTNYHRQRWEQVASAWKLDLNRLGVPLSVAPSRQPVDLTVLPSSLVNVQSQAKLVPPANASSAGGMSQPKMTVVTIGGGLLTPTARRAAPIAFTKRLAENIVGNIAVEVPRDRESLESATDTATWHRLAAFYNDEAMLDAGSLSVLRAKTPDETKLEPMVRAFQLSIAEDTVRNEYLMHSRLHQWLADGYKLRDITAFNNRVYSDLFLTPDSDPWLGLLPAEAYTGVTNGGVVLPQ